MRGAMTRGESVEFALMSTANRSKSIRVGLLAYGAIGHEHNLAVQATSGLELTAVCDTNPDRIAAALARIEAAMGRIDAAREAAAGAESRPGGASARIVELVNVHEKLREQVAESLRELDDLLAKLED